MATINWPIPTVVGQIYTSTNGDAWRWTGDYWQSIGTSSIGGTGATNQVTLWSGTNALTGTNAIAYTNTPGTNVNITISDSGYGSVLGRGTIDASVSNGSATNTIRSGSNTVNINPIIEFKRAKNSLVTPNTLTVGTYIGETKHTGAYDALGNYRTSAIIRAEATELWSAIASGTKLSINTISNGTTTPIERISIEGTGFIKFYNLYTFPGTIGTNGQVLATNGAGPLSWMTITAAMINAPTGTGTPNYLARWTPGSTTLGTSTIQDDGTSIGIGTLDSAYKFTIFDSNLNTPFRVTAYKVAGAGTVAGTFESYGTGSGPNKGIYVNTYNNANYNVGIHVVAGTTAPYALWLQDGTQNTGKFLKSVTNDGKSNWAYITTADVSGSISGTGVNNRITLWTDTSTVSSSPNIIWSDSGDATITLKGTSNTLVLGGTGSGLTSNPPAQFGLTTVNNSNIQYSIFTLKHARGTTAAQTPVLNGDILGDYRFDGGAGTGAYIRSQATIAHVSPSTLGSDLQFGTINNSNINAIRLRITNTGAIKFNEVYTFPTTDGTSNQVLKTDGVGNLSWTTPAAGTISGSGTLNYLARWTPSGVALGTSIIQDNGTTTSIGNTLDPSHRLLVMASTGITGDAIAGFNTSIISGNQIGINGQSYGAGNGTNIGVLAAAAANITLNIGVRGAANGVSIKNIGGEFTAAGATSNYAIKLVDGTQAAGRFLKSINSLGEANWANITAADITGLSSLTGGGATNKLAFWTNGTNLSYDNGLQVTSGTNPMIQIFQNPGGINGLLSLTPTSVQVSSSATSPLVQISSSTDSNSNLPIIQFYRSRAISTTLDQDILSEIRNANSGQQSVILRSRAEGDYVSSPQNAGASFEIVTLSRNTAFNTQTSRFNITGGFYNNISSLYQSPQVQVKNSTFEVGTVLSPSQLSASGDRKYQMQLVATDAVNGIYSQSNLPSSGPGGDSINTAIKGESINATGTRIGVYGVAGTSTILNIGVKGEVSGSGTGSVSVGGHFVVPTGATAYSLWLQDGTQAINKVLKSVTVDGKAQWAEPEPYKVYTFQVSQAGTAPPAIQSLLRNTFTTPITFTRTAVGTYQINCSEIIAAKTFVTFQSGIGPAVKSVNLFPVSGKIEVRTYIATTGITTDDMLYGCIEVRVYP